MKFIIINYYMFNYLNFIKTSNNLIQKTLNNPNIKFILKEAENWISDCEWEETHNDPNFVFELTPYQILNGIEKHYSGGLREFLKNINQGEYNNE